MQDKISCLLGLVLEMSEMVKRVTMENNYEINQLYVTKDS